MSEKLLPDKQDQPILTLIQQVKDGEIDPKTINREVRKQLVEVFLAEGYSAPSMAQILKVSDRTIKRDTASIREGNSVLPSHELAKKLVGNLIVKAETHCSYLMRLARSQGTSVSEKSLAEFYSWKVSKELIEKLQSLGYLPLASQKISAEVYHHEEENTKTLSELKDDLTLIEEIARKDGILDYPGRKQKQPPFLVYPYNLHDS